uniref:Uncharacterized protein n=1 Tax=Zonotrichia albicollis TaxID=44394 RepID=A0A8D2MB88_ZONAL
MIASQERQLPINLTTNYPDVLVVIGKTLLGKSSRKKSRGGILRMEHEDRNYFFWEHGICGDIETSLRDCTGRRKAHPYFERMQQGSNLLGDGEGLRVRVRVKVRG